MLEPNFTVDIQEGCKSLIFRDVTEAYSSSVPGGYGGTNIAKNNVTKTVLIIKVPSGAEYIVYSTYLPIQGDWQIDASAISDLQKVGSTVQTSEQTDDCGCAPIPQIFISPLPIRIPGDHLLYNNSDCEKPNALNYFEDGCTSFTYEVWGRDHIPVKVCKYGVAHKLCEGQTMWARKNGGWYNITTLGTITNLNFVFNTELTIEVYDEWEIRDEDGTEVLVKGIFRKYDCTNSNDTTTSDVDTLIASKTISFPFTCNIEKLMNNIAHKLTVGGGCDILKAGATEMQALSQFALSRAKILSMKKACGCDCIMSSIQSATTMLTQVIKTEKLDIETCA